MIEMAHPHTPEELAAISTFIHNLAGWLFVALSIVMLAVSLAVLGLLRGRWLG